MTEDRLTCACCQGSAAATPALVWNRPGLPAVKYRVGRHGSFKQSLLAALSARSNPELASLTARADDDFSIALLDAAATVCDVITFYQERIANESYLRTAGERRSIVELARMIGYELDPGVAAGTYLAFELDTAPGSPAEVAIAAGTRIQSVPGPGERPQTFETSEALVAHAAWNSLRAQQGRMAAPSFGDKSIYLAGIATGLRPGDSLLLVGDERVGDPTRDEWDMRRVETVTAEPEFDRTLVTWQRGLGKTTRFGRRVNPAQLSPRAFALRLRTGLYGANAADWRTLPGDVQDAYLAGADEPSPESGRTEWPDMHLGAIAGAANTIVLDAMYPTITAPSWVVLSRPNYQELYSVREVSEAAPAMFGLTNKATVLTVSGENLKEKFDDTVRASVLFGQSEALPLALEPIDEPVAGSELALDRLVPDLPPGRTVIARGPRARIANTTAFALALAGGDSRPIGVGETLQILAPPEPVGGGRQSWRLRDDAGFEGTATLADAELLPVSAQAGDEPISEPCTVAMSSAQGNARTVVTLKAPLANLYDRRRFALLANATPATHGESTAEVLGSGDAARTFQSFELKQDPLTYVFAAAAGGRASTLEVRVNGVEWQQVASFYGAGARDRVFVAHISDTDTTTLQFGDGANGARLPTGRENVAGRYRKGLGRIGNVRPDQLSLLIDRPLGVRSVTNPIAGTGGEDPEKSEDARSNAPVSVLTLGRVVSLADYADFARGFPGVAKAHATWVWDGRGRSVFITIAGIDGSDVGTGPVRDALIAALAKAAEPRIPVLVVGYSRVPVTVSARLLVDAAFEPAAVAERAQRRLAEALGFTNQNFGDAITESGVIALLADVPGTVAVELRQLARAPAGGRNPAIRPRLPQAGDDARGARGAELLTWQAGAADLVAYK